MNHTQPIRIASAIITDPDGRCLLVRKHGTTHFIQPGGKIEADESPLSALARELHEELDFQPIAASIRFVGQFTDRAVNEPGRQVIADIYHITTGVTDFKPAAEIDEILWYSPSHQPDVLLAPLTASQLMPLVAGLIQPHD